MIRAFSCAWLSAGFVLLISPLVTVAADQAAAGTRTAARQNVAAALAAEAAGDNAQRSELLYKAWQAASDLPEANWHIGRVRVDDQWLTLGEAASRALGDAGEAKYRELREKASGGRALRELARWCQKHGMPDRAKLHYAQLLNDPAADGGWKAEAIEALGLEQVNGVWFTREEVAARQKQLRESQADLEKWAPTLRRLQVAIDGDDFKRRDAAIGQFHALQEPGIIVSLEAFLSAGGPRFQGEAIKRLATFREYEATQALVKYAALSTYSLVRKEAMQALKQRPPHEYVPILVGALQSPLTTQFQVQWDRNGRLVYERALMQEGISGDLLLTVHHLSTPANLTVRSSTSDIKTVPVTEEARVNVQTTTFGTSRLDAFAAERDSIVTRAQNDQAAVVVANSQMEAANNRIFEVLEATTDARQPRLPASWWQWWQEHNQSYWPKQTYHVNQSSERVYYSQTSVHEQRSGTQWPRVHGSASCFVAGTLVRTAAGTRPIESLKAGDRVLSQDVDTGELAYKLVLRTTLRPPTDMLQLKIGDDQIVTTLGHPFWVNGHGWKMAKELKAGDQIHSLGGSLEVHHYEKVADNQAYNLVVDGFNTYFVGTQGILVHDREFRRPTQAIVPGLAASNLPTR